MDTYKEKLYGKILWECYRSKIYIIFLSLIYVLLSAGAVLFAIWHDTRHGIIFYVLAALVVAFSLWRINRVHYPVALICEKKTAGGHALVFRQLRLPYLPPGLLHACGIQRSGRRIPQLEPALHRRQNHRRPGRPSCAALLCITGRQSGFPKLGGKKTGRNRGKYIKNT